MRTRAAQVYANWVTFRENVCCNLVPWPTFESGWQILLLRWIYVYIYKYIYVYARPVEVQRVFSSAKKRNSGSLAPFGFSFAFSTRINGSPPMVFRVCDCWARARVRLPAATTVVGKQYISRYINRTYCATLPTGRERKKNLVQRKTSDHHPS